MLAITDFLSQRLWSITDNVVAGLIVLGIMALATRLPRPHRDWLKYANYTNAALVMVIVAWSPYPILAHKLHDILGMGVVCAVFVTAAMVPVVWLRWFALLLPLTLDIFGMYLVYRSGQETALIMAGVFGYPIMYTYAAIPVLIAHVVALRGLLRREYASGG